MLSTALAAALSALSLSGAVTPARADTASEAATPQLPLDEARASSKAQATGKPVPVVAATTRTDSEVANPDGTFTLTQSVAPVRKFDSGAWKPLDATLVRRSDRTVAPTLTTTALTLSGGGAGPLAVMKDHSRSLSLTAPASLGQLPAPTLDGSSATYADVLDGVDLKVTADAQGGFSEVLVVKSAEAAANPALVTLDFPTSTKNVALTVDPAGNIAARDATHRAVFSAPSPTMWDSSTAVKTASSSLSASRSAISGTDEPAAGAHIAPVAASYASGNIRLTPDAGLLAASSTVYPVYIDPTYSAAGGTVSSWTWVNSAAPNTSFWKDTSATGMHVGYQGWETPYHDSRAYAKFTVDSRLFGATVIDSRFYATETYAPSCTATEVQLWQTGPISSSTTWANKPARTAQWGSKTAAYGYSPSCPAQSLGFNITSHMQDVADKASLSSLTLGLQASDTDESNPYTWKKFDYATLSMSTTYNHRPTKPSTLVTSPATTCSSTVKTIGDGDVTLYAKVSDRDGGTLSNTFNITKTSGGAQIAKPTLSAASGTNAVYVLKKSVLEAAAGSSPLGVTWNVTSSDGTYTSPVSATCKFQFDTSRPGSPVVTDASAYDCGDDTSPVPYQVGIPASFTVAPNAADGATASYLYQLNGTTPVSLASTGPSTAISITPTRSTNVLTVTAVSAGGNIGDTANCILIAAPAATAVDGDLTGDGVPDLTAVGAQAGLSSGLWLARGTSDGQLTTSATNLGVQGVGVNSAGSPTDWNGTQAITGHFNTGAGFNDVLHYNPSTANGSILFGGGNGSALRPSADEQINLYSVIFTDSTGITGGIGNKATSIANGGALYRTVSEEGPTLFPDLLMLAGGQLWDMPCNRAPGAFSGVDNAAPLTGTNPTGTGDWTGWSITSSLVKGLPALFARHNSTGALYYYTPQQLLELASGVPVTPLQVASSGYSSAAIPVIQAAFLDPGKAHDSDDTNKAPDLRTVSANGASTARFFNATTGTLTAQTAQTLIAPGHAWPLGDKTEGSATTAVDTSGGLNLAGSGTGATWDTDDDVFSPNLALEGTATGAMTSNAALSLASSFTVSAWVKPTAVGGVIASQDGVHNSGFLLYPQSNKQWAFCLATADATRGYDCVAGGSAIIGQWTRITATYDPASKAMTLYMDDRPVARGSHTAISGFTGKFTLGNNLSNDARASFFKGNLSDVQVWNGAALSATQIGTMGNITLASAPYTFAGVGDYTSDGKVDLVAADAGGSLWLYPGNGGGAWSTSPLYIGSGVSGYTFAGMGDFDKAGYADLVGRAPSGTLRLFPGDLGHDLLSPVSNFASGWNGYTFAGTPDFNRDSKPDLIARHPDGSLKLFPGTGTGASLGAAVQLGTADWTGFAFAGVIDLNADTYPDVVARDASGVLWLYPGNGSNGLGTRSQLGTGWNGFTFAGIGDFNGDGNPDVIARDDASDILWLYPRTATAFSVRQQIGSGW
ncbi:VCBS repeat-containing protein [Streptomyces sp. MBT49]|uniref:LamG-like jellyroll fold domain-containing protein n=1 Tax=Streptomyces sp. MBT49 TaxID=1488380 RepID=UPI00190E277D|nr:FG-GAP-like repeat-containing protein [Streptomyces sp. MBT49]MBK3626349.1 VCBS repeat-containing protein [Streptomyces sp. MBT49]